MNDAFEARIAALEERRSALLAELAGFPADALGFHPEEGAWSLLDVADHVFLAEESTLAYVERRLADTRPESRTSWASRAKFAILRRLFASPLRVKVPAKLAGRMTPRAGRRLEDLATDWPALHGRWRAFLGDFPPELGKATIFRHPVTGWMDLERALHFLATHFDHHRLQMARIRAHRGFPDS